MASLDKKLASKARSENKEYVAERHVVAKKPKKGKKSNKGDKK